MATATPTSWPATPSRWPPGCSVCATSTTPCGAWRAHRPGLAHAAAVQVIVGASAGQFDPRLLDVFKLVAAQFEAVYRKNPD